MSPLYSSSQGTVLQSEYWHWYSQDTEHLPHTDSLYGPLIATHPFLWPVAITNVFSISRILSLQECYLNGIMQWVTFGDLSFFHLAWFPGHSSKLFYVST